MREDNILAYKNPSKEAAKDHLTEVLRDGAQRLLASAIEAEVAEHLSLYSNDRLEDGRRSVVRNGYLPERFVQTGIGDVAVKVPKVRDRSGKKRKFTSNIVPPYLKRSKDVAELLPALYLKGISTGDFPEALAALLGKDAKGLSSSAISRLKEGWEQEYCTWQARDLSHKRYAYVWADGVHFHIRSNDSAACMLVMIGVTDMGKKELIACDLGYRESTESWKSIIQTLKKNGLKEGPDLIIADGALGLWNAVKQEWPSSKQQRCWVHKIQNVLAKLPKTAHKTAKDFLFQIWQAETKKDALKGYDKMVEAYQDKYPKAMACLEKNKTEMLAFYDFPAIHWHHIRTSNAIESAFSSVRLRSDKVKNCVSEKTLESLTFKLLKSAEQRWQRIRGFNQLKNVIQGVNFVDGIRQNEIEKPQRCAA